MASMSSSFWFLGLQWAYALWQAVRNTRGFIFFYYTVQWLFYRTLEQGKPVVWVNKKHCSKYKESKQTWEDFRDMIMPMQEFNGIQLLDFKECWYNIKYKGKFYWVHQDFFFEIYYYDLKNCLFVTDLHHISTRFSLAQRISEEEAMLLMFNTDMHLYVVEDTTVIYGWEFNMEYNPKIAGFLATIPLLLQARNWSTASAYASLILLIVDFLRTPIYRCYDLAFFHFAKFIKLRVFKERTWLYTVFGLLSYRWRVSDRTKGHSYLTKEGDLIWASSYVSCEKQGDCRLERVEESNHEQQQKPLFTIRNGVIKSAAYNYSRYVAQFRVKKNMFVK